MKKFLTPFALAALAFSTLAASCKKDDNTATPTTPANPATTTGWRWKINGTGTEYVADSVHFSTQYKTFFAGGDTATMKHFFEINLTGNTAGTYDFATSGNSFYYSNKNGRTVPKSGTLVITSTANSKVSGTFSVSDPNNVFSMTSVTGTFTDVPVRP